MNPVRTDVRPWFEHALIALLALAVGLSFGLSYGLETHTSYFLYPLREIDPTFLRFDWLAAHTELVHKSFALIIRALSILGPLPWTVAIANVVLVATFILAIYGFLHANFKRDAIALFMFFVVIDRTVGGPLDGRVRPHRGQRPLRNTRSAKRERANRDGSGDQ